MCLVSRFSVSQGLDYPQILVSCHFGSFISGNIDGQVFLKGLPQNEMTPPFYIIFL